VAADGLNGRKAAAPLPVEDVQDAAARAGVRPGDCITHINGAVALDVLDVEMAAADGTMWLTVLRDGRPLDLVVAPRRGEWHGISLGHGGIGSPTAVCRNRCRFCFVDQVPRGLRTALYVKDDDYRLSFLHGNFMTLTNLGEADLARIEELRLEPLYVSLHAWDEDARVRLMGAAARNSRQSLERLAAAGLELHLQVVLCPGWNDAEVLAETVTRAAALPSVADLGIVPVSLAAEGDLRRVAPADAQAVRTAVAGWQEQYRRERGTAFVHAADEFHLLCGELPPESDAPEQYENGIGMAATLLAEAGELGSGPEWAEQVRVLCGTLAVPVIARVGELLAPRGGAALRPFPVTNRLFGEHVTVTGLLGGAEVMEALRADPLAPGEWLLVPRVFLPAALGRALDEVLEDQLRAGCDGRLIVADSLSEAFATMPG
jgi:putative radical SAM enzyme (TIGR03279 family)